MYNWLAIEALSALSDLLGLQPVSHALCDFWLRKASEFQSGALLKRDYRNVHSIFPPIRRVRRVLSDTGFFAGKKCRCNQLSLSKMVLISLYYAFSEQGSLFGSTCKQWVFTAKTHKYLMHFIEVFRVVLLRLG